MWLYTRPQQRMQTNEWKSRILKLTRNNLTNPIIYQSVSGSSTIPYLYGIRNNNYPFRYVSSDPKSTTFQSRHIVLVLKWMTSRMGNTLWAPEGNSSITCRVGIRCSFQQLQPAPAKYWSVEARFGYFPVWLKGN
jgi:hypothetical protein